jgi:dTDP-4-amino-4,6-dideoxygalactose transaminase
LSWVATANVIVRAGARPVFVDVDPQTRNIDLSRIEAGHHTADPRACCRWIWPACRSIARA